MKAQFCDGDHVRLTGGLLFKQQCQQAANRQADAIFPAGEASMSKVTYAVVITIGIVMFAIGALAADRTPNPATEIGSPSVEQGMPLPRS
jgi:hypothetical protein